VRSPGTATSLACWAGTGWRTGGVALASHLERLVAAIERATGFRFLSPDVYPITEVPSRLLASDVVLVAGLTFVLTVLATIYPAWRAARIRPAEVLGES